MICELWRQDDHGNRFLVGCFPTLAAAEQRLAELAHMPHKQTYWIETPATGREESDA